MLWLQEAPSQALQQCLQQCLMDASAAIEAFKAKKKGFPKFQARGDGDSFRIPHSASSPDGLGRSQRSSPHPEGRLRAIQKVASDSRQDQADDGFRRMRALVCLGRDGDGFRQRRSASSGEVGIDLGIAQTVTLSDGTVFQLDVESIKKHEKQIAVLQRQLCRNKEARQKLAKLGKANPFDKREPSRKRRRLKAKIQNHHRCIRNIRRDFMLKTAHTIAQNYGGVAWKI